jgi:hypothetical protein
MKYTNIFFFLAVFFVFTYSLYPMEPESDSEHEDIEMQVTEPQEIRQPVNVNINIMGFDPETEDGKKKLEEVMEIVRGLNIRTPATVRRTGPGLRSSQQSLPCARRPSQE